MLQEFKQPQNLNEVDLMFLHSSPNLYKDFAFDSTGRKAGFQVPMALDFLTESGTIKDALTESQQTINYQGKVATKENFELMIRKKPKVLHISCHGLRNEKHTMGLNYDSIKEEGHFLLFENSYGAGELVSAKQLRIYMESSDHRIDVVYVAACDSEDIGRIFQRCGARHVVCIEQKHFVLDKAAINFTNTFYSSIFKGVPICSAFAKAKNAVSFIQKETEGSMFVMLLGDTETDNFEESDDDHECYSLPKSQSGPWRCLSDHNHIKQIPSKLDNLRFREKEMSQLLEYLLEDKHRIVSLLGLRGVGKSCLARNTLHYVAERKIFTGGILFIQLKDIKSIFSLLKLIMRAIMRFLEIEKEAKRNLADRCCSQDRLIEYLISFFNNEQEEPLKQK